MRTVRDLATLAVGVVLVSGVTWMLMGSHDILGGLLLAGLLLAHGLVHLMFLVPAPPRPATAPADGMSWPFDLRRSWLVGSVGVDAVMTSGRVLIAVVVGCSALAAFATVGVLIPSALWATLVVGAAGGSLLLLGIGFSPALALGVAIDAALLWLAIWSAWTPVA